MFIADPPQSRTTMNRALGNSHPDFTPRQGQYLAFIHTYTLVNGRPPAQADIQLFFSVTPPSVHQMLLTLYRFGQAFGTIADEGAHPFEGGCLGRGEGWSDSRIAEALDTSIANVERTRRQLVEEGFEAVPTRKYNPNSAPRRIFDGVAEAKLIALACGPAPAGYARWTLSLLEEKVVEMNIVEQASDNTIGRTLKKTSSSRVSNSNG
jgi:hypothetical protein